MHRSTPVVVRYDELHLGDALPLPAPAPGMLDKVGIITDLHLVGDDVEVSGLDGNNARFEVTSSRNNRVGVVRAVHQ